MKIFFNNSKRGGFALSVSLKPSFCDMSLLKAVQSFVPILTPQPQLLLAKHVFCPFL